MVLLNLYFVVCSLRINTVFTLIFVGAGIGFALLTGAFWAAAEGSAKAATLMTVGGPMTLLPSSLISLARIVRSSTGS